MPDIDIDFCIEKRGDVIDYVTKKYGEDKVCQIITFGTYAAKAAVKAVARVLKLDFTTSNNLTKMMVTGPKTYIDDSKKYSENNTMYVKGIISQIDNSII
mgnify:CR=1 FL=1